ncbi:MAG: hypothetical protein M0R51_14275 [Clostridia bacterium]|jgi:hypothetical protein|nr:hypothetical protein [Clostridia bacterium]
MKYRKFKVILKNGVIITRRDETLSEATRYYDESVIDRIYQWRRGSWILIS